MLYDVDAPVIVGFSP